tara:strand:+ start:48937 stop:49923 length:987 start_codon:yes stop_codon:yes gene_type:complete
MYSFIILSKFDSYTIEKKKLIKFAYDHLFEKLNNMNIRSEILIADMGSNLGKLSDQDIFNKFKNSNIKTKFINFKIKNSNLNNDLDFRNSSSEIINLSVQNAEYENIVLKAQDTIFNDDIFKFLKENKNENKNYFYNTYRYDADYNYSEENEKKFLNDIKFENNFIKNKFLNEIDYFYFMKLHTNACGDFLLFNKNFFSNFYMPNFPIYNDLFLVYDLYFLGGIQKIIENGKVFKLKGLTSFTNSIRTLELSFFQKYFESILYKIKLNVRTINIIRGLFNYPKAIFNNKKIDSYERYVYLRILFRKYNLIKSFSKKNNNFVIESFKTL